MAYDYPDTQTPDTDTTPDVYEVLTGKCERWAEKAQAAKDKLYFSVDVQNQATAVIRQIQKPRNANLAEHDAAVQAIENEVLTELQASIDFCSNQQATIISDIEALDVYDFWNELTDADLRRVEMLLPLIKSDVNGNDGTLAKRIRAAVASKDLIRMALYSRFIGDAKRNKRVFSKEVLMINIDYGEHINPNAEQIAAKQKVLSKIIQTKSKLQTLHTQNSTAAKARVWKPL